MPNWLGDIILGISVAVRKRRNDHEPLTMIVPEYLAPLCRLLADFPIIPYSRSTGREFKASVEAVKRVDFKKLYLLPRSFSSAWFGYHTGITRRRGLRSEFRDFLLTERLSSGLRNQNDHLLREYSEVLETEFQEPEEWEGVAIDRPGKHDGCVVFCPGAKYGPAKQWGGYEELADILPDKKIVVLGAPEEGGVAERIAGSHPERVTNLAGKTTLPEAASIIAGSSCVVSNDSGLMHLAGYLGVKVVGIFGSTTPQWTRPLGKSVRAAYTKEPCSPCFRRRCRFGHYDCLKKISAGEIKGLMEERADG